MSKRANLFILWIIPSFLTYSQTWELAQEKEQISVYTREPADLPIKEFKAVALFDATIIELKQVIVDVSSYPQWYDHCKSGKLLKQDSEGSFFNYLEIALPFPFQNRDIVSEMLVYESADSVFIQSRSKEGLVPEKDDLVRMKVAEGSWVLKKINENQTLVTHQSKGDPGGNIPSYIINMFIVQGPISTFQSLKDYINEQKD